ncbi:unnamed protein product [Allacma fusca]|uniref:CRAL-TRIO domain-containing protein n=1 Tax=Allacma fusca TaxID=39272 RepID=A0A8J2LFI8_9HEXA|nr:unnamed protein product [Allacma fusca]
MEKANDVILELQERVSDLVEYDDRFQEAFYLYFWLKVRNFNVDSTEKYIRETVQWLQENKAQAAVEQDYDPELYKCFSVYTTARTRTGFAAYQSYAGRFRFGETISKFGKKAVVHYWLQILSKAENLLVEYNREAQEFHGTSVSSWPLSKKSVLIMNMKHCQYSEFLSKDTISVFVTLVKMAVNYFPAIEGTLIFINAGRMMEFFFKLIQPIMKGSNIELQVFGCKEEKWRPAIQEYCDPDEIMTAFGGNVEGPVDP